MSAYHCEYKRAENRTRLESFIFSNLPELLSVWAKRRCLEMLKGVPTLLFMLHFSICELEIINIGQKSRQKIVNLVSAVFAITIRNSGGRYYALTSVNQDRTTGAETILHFLSP